MVSSYTIFRVYGYQLSLDHGEIDIVSTSIVDVQTNVDAFDLKTKVYVDGKVMSKVTPTMLALEPGNYTVRIEKAGYYPWEKRIQVKSYYVTLLDNVVLVPIDIASKRKMYTSFRAHNFRVSPTEKWLASVDNDFGRLQMMSLGEQSDYETRIDFDCHFMSWLDDGHLVCSNKIRNKHYVAYIGPGGQAIEISALEVGPDIIETHEIRNGNEIWDVAADSLLTRFSFDIEDLEVIGRSSALIVAGDNRVMVCDADTDNCAFVSSNDSNTPVGYIHSSAQILFIKDDRIYAAKLLLGEN